MKKEKLEGLIIIILTITIGSCIIWNMISPLFVLVGPGYVVENEDRSFDCIEKDYCEDISNYLIVTVTKYNPVPEQCDSDPLITADGSYIDTLLLMKGNLRWIAISRDLREYFNYGDTVIIKNNSEIEGEYVVRDTMNPRWKMRVDLLSPRGDSLGKWDDVYIYKK